jgi:hypothetical protein
MLLSHEFLDVGNLDGYERGEVLKSVLGGKNHVFETAAQVVTDLLSVVLIVLSGLVAVGLL